MKSIRTTVAGVTLAISLPAMLAACGSQSASPAAGPSPSSTPSATATASPPPTPAPAQAPGSTSPVPSIRVVSSRIAYPWHWPNDVARPGRVTHANPVPPVPELVQISVGYHSADRGQPPYNRMSFTFTGAFPSYRFQWVSELVGDASGQVVPLRGIGTTRAVPLSNPQTTVRAYEVEVVTATGQHRYVVAIDINAAQHN